MRIRRRRDPRPVFKRSRRLLKGGGEEAAQGTKTVEPDQKVHLQQRQSQISGDEGQIVESALQGEHDGRSSGRSGRRGGLRGRGAKLGNGEIQLGEQGRQLLRRHAEVREDKQNDAEPEDEQTEVASQ